MKMYAAYDKGKLLGKGDIYKVAKLLGMTPDSARTASAPCKVKSRNPLGKRVEKLEPGLLEYALYDGDTLMKIGTRAELADFLEVSEDRIRYLASPSHKNRKGKRKNNLLVERIEYDEEYEAI